MFTVSESLCPCPKSFIHIVCVSTGIIIVIPCVLHQLYCYFSPQNLQTGLMDNEVKLALLAGWVALFVIFAGRKFTQPIKVILILTLD